ncbi:asparagine synthase-related protein [Pelagerythrobacter sp.]|uniref:asparagine synthase-related protein n=1 Tax=Pelagerythrobacter sp. TaxID=2800702 RepID=UPI0035B193FB
MFAGIVTRRGGGDPRAYAEAGTLLAALDPYGQADRTGEWRADDALMVQALRWNTRESQHEKVPARCPATGRVLVGWLRLENRAELLVSLGVGSPEAPDDAQLVLAAHRQWGEGCADRLHGDFAFAIYDPARHAVFCARDALGVKPFFYHLGPDLFVFAGTAAVFPALRSFDASPSREWLARYLIGESADPAKTAYANVAKLPPAHTLAVEREGVTEPRRYFAFADTAPQADRRDLARVDAYREAFHRAVEDRLRSAYRIGAENSGGLDSATIIGHAVRTLPGGGAELPCFSVCHMEREASAILDVAVHCGIRDNHVLTRPTYQPSPEETARAIRVLGHPPQHTHALFHAPFLERCRDTGVRTLLSGFGGDEVVTAQAEFLSRELTLARRYRALVDIMPGILPMRVARAAKRVVEHARGRIGYHPANPTPRLARSILRREVAEQYGLTGFIAAKADAYRNARTLGDHLLGKPAFRTMLTGRLEGCTLMGASYGVEYRWPMLDRRLIERYLATPSIEKGYRRWGRYLHRRACEGTIPDAILWKESKDLGGIPHLARDRRFAAPDLENLPPVLSEIVDRHALEGQARTLERAVGDEAHWIAHAAERNNLRDLHSLSMWLNITR